jgi:glycosyltransferase involved in cell wall biosynthesis
MKILLTTESYYPNIDGGAIAQRNLIKELLKNGHDARVIAPGLHFKNYVDNNDGYTIYRPRGATLPGYMKNRYKFSFFPYFQVKKIIKSFQPDVINACSPYPNSLSALHIAKQYHIPFVGSIHVLPQNILAPFLNKSIYSKLEPYAWKWLIWFFNQCNRTVVPTRTGGEMFQSHGLSVDVTPISNGIDSIRFNPQNDGTYLKKRFHLPDKQIILYTGRINEEKSLDILIKAVPYVVKNLDVHFILVGSGGKYRQYLIELAKKIGIDKHISFIPFLSDDDFPNIYTLADLFVMPSEAELQSIVTLEALASGLPVISVDKGAVPELATPENGLLFRSKDSHHLARQIITMLTKDQMRASMGKKSLEIVKKHTMDFVCKEYEKVYEVAITNCYNSSSRK